MDFIACEQYLNKVVFKKQTEANDKEMSIPDLNTRW
jgi:hypothetical protein